jgi:hypothetical protein
MITPAELYVACFLSFVLGLHVASGYRITATFLAVIVMIYLGLVINT